jgi:methylphosphotriester-DNA--protein-cysteine methyltransferase
MNPPDRVVWAPLPRQLHRQIDLLDLWSFGEQLRRVSHQGSRDGTCQMGLPARRLRTVLGKSPLEYFQDLRVERAVHLLQTSNSSVDRIAAEIGYSDGVTLRTLLRRKLGRGVRELRSR